MKTKFFIVGIVLLCAIIAKINYNQKIDKKLLTNLSLANIEALASFDENTNNKGLPTSKEITKYFYNDKGQLIKTEKYTQSCCANGSLDCTNPLCTSESL